MHFAGFASVGESVENPATYYRNNVAGSLSLLDAMRAAGVRTFIFSSSCAVYGSPARLPVAEDAPPAPMSPYGRTKLMIERVLEDAAAAYGLGYVALRYFNAAGADPEGMIGDYRRNSTHLIPRALKAAAGQSEQLEVYGDDYPTPDGTCIRDYVHVADLALGHVQALQYLQRGGQSSAVNLGTGQGLSVLEVLASVERIAGRSVPSARRPRRPGDPPILVADTALATRLLGFAATHSDIDRIVETAWRFYDTSLKGRMDRLT